MTMHHRRRAAIGALMLTSVFLAACESKEEQAARFAESGQAYLAEGDLERADLQFNNALFKDGQNIIALRGAAEVAGERDQLGRQGRMLMRLLDVLPDDVEANATVARLSLLSGDADQARFHAEQALALAPENIEALTILGSVQVLENSIEEARGTLQRALDLDPENAEIYSLIAATSIREDNYEDAITTIDRGIRNAENPETLLLVKLVLAERYRTTEEVLAIFDQLIDLAPDNGAYREQLGNYHLSLGNPSAARESFEAALPLIEQKQTVMGRIVAIDREQNGVASAEETLKGYLAEYGQENEELIFALATFLCQTEQIDRCRAEYETLADNEDLTTDQKIRALNGVADVALAQRDLATAASSVEEILAIDETNGPALVTRGQLLLLDGKADEAVEVFREALASQPDNAEGLVYLALAYERQGQISFADAQFARAIDQVGYEKPVVDQFRAFLLRQGERERASDLLSRYLRENPGDAGAALDQAKIALQQQRYDESIEMAGQLFSSGEFGGDARVLAAQAHLAERRFADALVLLDPLYSNNPSSRQIFSLRAQALNGLGRQEQVAGELYQRIENGEPTSADYALYGDVLRAQGEFAEAIEMADRGIALEPTSEALYILGYASARDLGDADRAADYLETAVEEASTNVQARTLIANDLLVSGERDAALEVLRTIQADNALSPLTANNLASLLLEKGDADAEALEIAENLSGTENPYFADTLGLAYLRAGNLSEADRYTAIAADGLPENSDVLFHRGQVLAAMEDTEAARDLFTRARELHSEDNTVPLADIEAALGAL